MVSGLCIILLPVGQVAYTESNIVIISDFIEIHNSVELSDSGWIRAVISNGDGELYYRKYGKTVELRGSVVPSVSGGGWTICTEKSKSASFQPSI